MRHARQLPALMATALVVLGTLAGARPAPARLAPEGAVGPMPTLRLLCACPEAFVPGGGSHADRIARRPERPGAPATAHRATPATTTVGGPEHGRRRSPDVRSALGASRGTGSRLAGATASAVRGGSRDSLDSFFHEAHAPPSTFPSLAGRWS